MSSDAVRGWSAGSAFTALAGLFALLFGIVALLLALEHKYVFDATERLQRETVPEIIRSQRLARNLERLCQEGDHIFSATLATERKQAMLVVTLIASHPSVLEHPGAAQLAAEAEKFLANANRKLAANGASSAEMREQWKLLNSRIDLLVDDVSVQGTLQASANLDRVAEAMVQARYKLAAVVLIVGLFPLTFLILLRRYLIGPLQRIDDALSHLGGHRPAPSFPPTGMREIRVVEDAIGELHALLQSNEDTRRGLEKLANRDGLTGLMNRRHFMMTAEMELQRAQRYRRPVTVAMADLDHFKKLNDTYGHPAGDLVLRAFADRVRETLRQSDIVCRYGGEEFAFLFPESALGEAEALAERLRARCTAPVELTDGRKVSFSISVGLADTGESGIEAALARADAALYEAKHLGRNRVVRSGESQLALPGLH
jgi:diguanylate cyclase (GGDEF)-like protein